MSYDKGFWNMPDDWIPSDPPEEGTPSWEDQMAIDFAIQYNLLEKSRVFKLPKVKGYELGYFVVRKLGNGTDYFRVDNIQHYAELMEGQFDAEE